MIERIVSISKNSSNVSFLPERWGHVVSCVIGGVEIFYDKFWDISKPKGGMPYMFPNAGAFTPADVKISGYYLEQHGFGRLSKWQSQEDCSWVQRLTFESNNNFPFSWIVENKIEIQDDGSVKFTHDIKNISLELMPVSTGLHPYFRIPEGDKSKIEWRFKWGEEIKSDVDVWSEWWTGTYDTPKDGKIIFFIPGIWEICLEISKDYKKFWVWSLPGKDFVCVEPVMGNPWMIVHNPILIKSGETNSNFMNIGLNREEFFKKSMKKYETGEK